MDDEEYLKLAGLIGRRLSELGLDDIADFGNYMDEEGEERSLPDGRTLVKRMLGAFDRYLAANAAEAVTESLLLIGNSLDDGARPESAILHFEDDRLSGLAGPDEGVPIPTLGNMVEIRSELHMLEAALMEASPPSEPDSSAS